MILGSPSPKPRNLTEWLATATLDLVPSAQARIRAEISAHHAEAVDAHLAAGLAEPAAHQAALTELGDAQAAAVRFRRGHLTADVASHPKAVWTDSLCMLLIVIFISWDFYPEHPLAWMAVALGLTLLVMLNWIAVYWLRRGRTERVTQPRLVLLAAVNWLTIGFLYPVGHLNHPSALSIFSSICMFVVAVFAIVRYLRLRRKLLAASEADLPSGGAAA